MTETYSKKALKRTGFADIREVDNTYEILTRDLPDLLDEINEEKKRILGANDPVKIV